MTTLKQILHKHCDMPEYYQYQNEINAFKEWLQQKLTITSSRKRARSLIYELLEELENADNNKEG